MPDKLIEFVKRNNSSLFVQGVVTFLFPKLFLRKYFQGNTGRGSDWHGKKAGLTISFDCDYPKDVAAMPELIGVLSEYPFKTSFACVGHWIEKYPDEHRVIVDAGHEIVNHTYSHPDNEILNPGRRFKTISRQEKKEEVEKCHEICRRVLGYEPKGCRIPHFKNLFTEQIYGILKELGYKYSSSTHLMNTDTHGMPFTAGDGIIEFPLSTCPKHPFTVFDTWHSFNSSRLAYRMVHRTEEEYTNLFKWLIDVAIETNSYINVYIDPADIHKMSRLKEIFDYIRAQDVWVATYEEMLGDIK